MEELSFDKTINLSNITVSPKAELDSFSSGLNFIIEDTRYPSVVAAGSNVYVIWLDNVTRNFVQPSQIIQDNSTDSTIFSALPEYIDYFDIFFKRSTDGGASFGNTLNLSNSTSNTQNPHLAVAGTNVYLVWNGGVDGIYFRRSTDEGASFEPTVNLVYNRENNTSWLDNPQISASNSNVYIVYQQSYECCSSSEERMIPQLFFISSNNTGTTFSEPIILSNNNGVYDSSGDTAQVHSVGSNVYVVWPTDIDVNMYFRRSTNGGASFEPVINLNNSITKVYSETPRLVANGSNLYIAWEESVNEEVQHQTLRKVPKKVQMAPVYIPVLARSIDGGASFDTATNVIGSDSKLSISESDASSVWPQDGEIFFRRVGSATLSSLQITDSQTSETPDSSESILIDGRIGKGEWEKIPSSAFHQSDNKVYQIKPASTYDNESSYFVVGVQGTDFVGGSNLTLMFDNRHNGKLDDGDDILKIIGGSDSTGSIKDNFEDSFWNSDTTPQIQKDEGYGGTEDGHVASSFYNETEVFEIIHPLCSSDSNHDFCITDPSETLGFSLKFEVNDSSDLLFFDDIMSPFSLSRGGVFDTGPRNPTSPAPTLIPPAAYILEPFQRLSSNERTEFLGNLTSEERTEILTGPTEEGVKDFFMNKLTPEQLGNFLINKLTPEETDKLFNSIPEDDILNRLGIEDRKAVSDKLSSFQLGQ